MLLTRDDAVHLLQRSLQQFARFSVRARQPSISLLRLAHFTWETILKKVTNLQNTSLSQSLTVKWIINIIGNIDSLYYLLFLIRYPLLISKFWYEATKIILLINVMKEQEMLTNEWMSPTGCDNKNVARNHLWSHKQNEFKRWKYALSNIGCTANKTE